MAEWIPHYNGERPHSALGPGLPDEPTRRATLTGYRVASAHRVVARARLGGLHHDYGLERVAMNLQQVESFFDIVWTDGPLGRVTYGDVFHQNEAEQSAYNFEHADVNWLLQAFDAHERTCQALLEAKLPLPAYEQVLKASHTFNLVDARRAISVTERQRYILRVRKLARGVAETYLHSRELLGFPLLKQAGAAA